MYADAIIDEILRREGSAYINDPHDRGGPTKYGITQKSWDAYRERHKKVIDGLAIPEFVRNIDRDDAVAFYRTEYVAPFEWIMDERLLGLVVDCAVNHGKHRVSTWLQEAAGVTVDGVVGPITKAAVNAAPELVYRRLLKRRFKFYAEIATDQQPVDPDAKFLRGWINRACEFI